MERNKGIPKGFRPFSKPIEVNSNEGLRIEAKTRNWKGKGSKVDPFIIESQITNFRKCNIVFTNLYVIIRNSKIIGLELRRCHNITIETCKINDLNIIACSELLINNSSLYGKTHLHNSSNLVLKKSTIYNLHLKNISNSEFLNCKLALITSDLSRANIFKKNEIPDNQIYKVFKLLPNNKIVLLLILVCFVGFLVYLVALALSSEISQIFVNIILPVVLLVLILPPIFKYAKKISRAKKLNKNSII